ncbi:hypothetical protein [Candidatus Palauibacter sp.]|uniref:hypothetical protein n=1 Tax=Candidatus Palauibacter sp. TaxID=3101350 RepID=UPI003AF2D708
MELIIPLFAIFFVIGVPVLTLATRFALRPLVRDVTQALGPRREDRDTIARLADRISQLEDEARARDALVDRLADAELFRRQLEERT